MVSTRDVEEKLKRQLIEARRDASKAAKEAANAKL